MALLKNSNKLRANSILESVVALCIISICLYIAMLIFSSVLTQKSSPKFYQTQHHANELFYLAQVQLDSLNLEAEDITIATTPIHSHLKEVKISYRDSSQTEVSKKFYIHNHEE